MFKRFKDKKKGFSLIELLIVIAIIGIIATIAIPLLLSARNNAINEKARNSLRTVVSAQAAYYAKHGDYGTAGELNSDADGESFIDDRFLTGDLGNGITVTITPADQEYEATASGATASYTATESGDVTTD